MRLNPADLLRPSAPSAPETRPPLSGSRSQALQRLQVGVFGLAAMLLLVALANIILTNARQNQAQVTGAAENEAQDTSESDPLADAGVVPAASHSGDAADGDTSER